VIDLVKPVDTLSQGLKEREYGVAGEKTDREIDEEKEETQVGRCDQEIQLLNVVTG